MAVTALSRSAPLAALLALAAALPARAQEAQLPAFTGYVVDAARILDAASVQEIRGLASRLDQSGVAQLAVVTLPTLGDSDIREVSVDLFKKWGLGHDKKRSDGVLLVFVPGKPGRRKVRVEVGYGLEGVLPDGKVGALLDQHAVPLLKQDRYGEAAAALARAIAGVLQADAATGGDTAPTKDSPRGGKGIGMVKVSRSRPDDGRAAGALGLAVLAMGGMLVWLLVEASKRRFPGKAHGIGLAGASAATLAGLLLLGGLGGWIAFVLGLIANGAAWASIASHRCPRCRGWMTIDRAVIEEPTYFSSGLAEVTKACTSCRHREVTEEVIPRREVATTTSSSGGDSGWSSDSGGGGDSFSGGGGGESGGGGADRDV